jgi:hypothetical protein
VEFELLDRGFHMGDVGTATLSWTELHVLMERWARLPHNAVAESIAGFSVWSVGEQLSAYIVDLINMGNYYTLRAAGNKTAKKPRPIPRPWDDRPVTFGSGAIPYDQIDEWIDSTIRED